MITRGDVANIFLKKKTHWQNGLAIVPVDLTEDTIARQEFSAIVLNKSVSAVKNYWQQQIFSGRGIPPVEKRTDDEVLAYVKTNPNAIGYISAGTRSDGVRTVELAE